MRDSSITNKERLQHILEAISKINGFIDGQCKESFLNSDVLQNAILFQFAILGEAVVHIDRELLDKHPFTHGTMSGRLEILFYTNIMLLKFGLFGKLQKTIYPN